MVRLFPGTDVHVEMAQDAAQHLARLLERYNWAKVDHRLSADRWRRFWRGIAPIERSLVVMYVQSNNGGAFYGTVEFGVLPQALRVVDTRRSRFCATDAVLREFANLRQIFIRACVNADEIAFQWHTTHRDAMELCGPALTDSAATWLASDGSVDLGATLLVPLLSAGLAESAAQQTAIELSLHVRYLVQDRQKIVCDRVRGEEGVDLAGITASCPDNPTTRERLVQARLGQGTYRDDVLVLWDNACAVTGCSLASVVVASHAKPWAHSTDDERLDPNNGLPLVATLDKLFDAGLIGFDPLTGAMHVASMVSAHDRALLGVPAPLRRKPSSKQAAFLRYHLDHVFQSELVVPAVSVKK
ncbi:HNH endonuclease [Burkholderia stagnalis]|uniref:HNH endonuclease n=1 Tax=Burkholderia stagnalis TaxID=1503054 RepID=UPI000F5D68D5|nr:HNH endonuclease signature motif containing protein [Burkholderia stagnalis]RQY86014.1 HNH endonuclease [Burkholderia stagnalis]